jgi:hypothetical protein
MCNNIYIYIYIYIYMLYLELYIYIYIHAYVHIRILVWIRRTVCARGVLVYTHNILYACLRWHYTYIPVWARSSLLVGYQSPTLTC